ncbi:hypothetical protein F0562_014854 [Nyssa sinensis]|uniref:Uncharacterized protein n=1 Tax=Nyssa sinensis TaxID=561372 RepID=A0A5J4ZS97_9ASTE|nr:hypothetical protein F0562_014854 [Nyssa sinensis]
MAPPMRKWLPDGWNYIDYEERPGSTVKDFDPSNVSESNSRAAAYRKPKNGKRHSKAKKGRTKKQSTTNPPIAAEQKKQTDSPAGNQCLMSPCACFRSGRGKH